MKPTDEEIEPDNGANEVPEIDVQEVAESLPAYQEFQREQRDNSLTFGDL